MLDALPCTWVNPREADSMAHHKPYQWAVARALGLRLPRTLVTNKPDEARAFIQSIGVGKVVFKAFLASTAAWRETRLVEESDLAQLDLVKYSPVIFQEFIEGVDLRITIVGDKVFAGEIDARKTRYPVDMRMVVGESTVRPVQLERRVEERLLQLQRRLQLVYGAIDMRRTEAGEYYFLEVNPAGQWQFVERYTGLPITRAMADYLAMQEDSARLGVA
jgi:glutathione synthase/RimK-type ligase-like ATP-grasp enzyme